MTPAATLQDLIEFVRAEAPSGDALDQLAEASRASAELAELGDALVGHFVEESRRRGHSWAQVSGALGVTKQAAHKRFSLPEMRARPGFNRFTPRARATLRGAAERAKGRRRTRVGTDDLLLALFEPADGVAAQILGEVGITREACERELVEAATAQAPTAAGDRRPRTRQLKQVVRSAVEEALRLQHRDVGPEHLLLGLYSDPEDPAARALVALGASYEEIRARLAGRPMQR